ncbi:MAG TPA: nuclease-related domain-containing protein, partial [Actinomycetota bacterium]|nr:nuclease-related domain-containing protein [Actinomycetota bacterium]
LLALADDPQSTRAWNVGAKGEEHLGAILDRAAAKLGWVVLHDRRIPGSRANIDHVVVSRLGASVIDAKNYKGDVAKRDVGGWKRADERLFVGGRDCSRLVQGVLKQREVVEGVLAGSGHPAAPVWGVLCFTEGSWRLFARPFTLEGAWVTWPKAALELMSRPPGKGIVEVPLIASRLEAVLRPA